MPTITATKQSAAPCRLGDRVQDILWLLALGAAWRGQQDGTPVTGEQLLRAVRSPHWTVQPCSEVVVACLEEMLRCDCLIGDPCRGLTITDLGKSTFGRLMAEPAASLRNGSGRLAVRVRLAFLDLLTGDARRTALDALIQAAETDLSDLSQGLDGQWAGPFGGSWAIRDMATANHDLNALGHLRALLDTQAA